MANKFLNYLNNPKCIFIVIFEFTFKISFYIGHQKLSFSFKKLDFTLDLLVSALKKIFSTWSVLKGN